MIRTALSAASLVALAPAPARAETLPLHTTPAGYTYDQAPVSFGLSAPGVAGLTGYEIQFTVSAGQFPYPPDLTVTAAPPPSRPRA